MHEYMAIQSVSARACTHNTKPQIHRQTQGKLYGLQGGQLLIVVSMDHSRGKDELAKMEVESWWKDTIKEGGA
jgi:hypothetical protein